MQYEPEPQLEPDLAQGQASSWLNLFERQPEPDAEALEWAVAAAHQSEPLSSGEQERLQAIALNFLRSREDFPEPSLAELEWFQDCYQRHQAGEPLSQHEEARLRDIMARTLLKQRRQLFEIMNSLPPAPKPPDAQDLLWLRSVYQAALAGHLPDAEDYQRFMQLLKAYYQDQVFFK